ncbi:hypothetical protein BSKO_09838 [Bryopsis sp. KO-2023]|nr:hypothetical protein BSKO_09838 [Bryopsis sp. KO-2023]
MNDGTKPTASADLMSRPEPDAEVEAPPGAGNVDYDGGERQDLDVAPGAAGASESLLESESVESLIKTDACFPQQYAWPGYHGYHAPYGSPQKYAYGLQCGGYWAASGGGHSTDAEVWRYYRPNEHASGWPAPSMPTCSDENARKLVSELPGRTTPPWISQPWGEDGALTCAPNGESAKAQTMCSGGPGKTLSGRGDTSKEEEQQVGNHHEPTDVGAEADTAPGTAAEKTVVATSEVAGDFLTSLVPPANRPWDAKAMDQMSSEELHFSLKKWRTWLLFLRHCATCPRTGSTSCWVGDECRAGKELWGHMLTCRDRECDVQSCLRTREVWVHQSSCESPLCKLCVPLRTLTKEGDRVDYEFGKQLFSRDKPDDSTSKVVLTGGGVTCPAGYSGDAGARKHLQSFRAQRTGLGGFLVMNSMGGLDQVTPAQSRCPSSNESARTSLSSVRIPGIPDTPEKVLRGGLDRDPRFTGNRPPSAIVHDVEMECCDESEDEERPKGGGRELQTVAHVPELVGSMQPPAERGSGNARPADEQYKMTGSLGERSQSEPIAPKEKAHDCAPGQCVEGNDRVDERVGGRASAGQGNVADLRVPRRPNRWDQKFAARRTSDPGTTAHRAPVEGTRSKKGGRKKDGTPKQKRRPKVDVDMLERGGEDKHKGWHQRSHPNEGRKLSDTGKFKDQIGSRGNIDRRDNSISPSRKSKQKSASLQKRQTSMKDDIGRESIILEAKGAKEVRRQPSKRDIDSAFAACESRDPSTHDSKAGSGGMGNEASHHINTRTKPQVTQASVGTGTGMVGSSHTDPSTKPSLAEAPFVRTNPVVVPPRAKHVNCRDMGIQAEELDVQDAGGQAAGANDVGVGCKKGNEFWKDSMDRAKCQLGAKDDTRANPIGSDVSRDPIPDPSRVEGTPRNDISQLEKGIPGGGNSVDEPEREEPIGGAELAPLRVSVQVQTDIDAPKSPSLFGSRESQLNISRTLTTNWSRHPGAACESAGTSDVQGGKVCKDTKSIRSVSGRCSPTGSRGDESVTPRGPKTVMNVWECDPPLTERQRLPVDMTRPEKIPSGSEKLRDKIDTDVEMMEVRGELLEPKIPSARPVKQPPLGGAAVKDSPLKRPKNPLLKAEMQAGLTPTGDARRKKRKAFEKESPSPQATSEKGPVRRLVDNGKRPLSAGARKPKQPTNNVQGLDAGVAKARVLLRPKPVITKQQMKRPQSGGRVVSTAVRSPMPGSAPGNTGVGEPASRQVKKAKLDRTDQQSLGLKESVLTRPPLYHRPTTKKAGLQSRPVERIKISQDAAVPEVKRVRSLFASADANSRKFRNVADRRKITPSGPGLRPIKVKDASKEATGTDMGNVRPSDNMTVARRGAAPNMRVKLRFSGRPNSGNEPHAKAPPTEATPSITGSKLKLKVKTKPKPSAPPQASPEVKKSLLHEMEAPTLKDVDQPSLACEDHCGDQTALSLCDCFTRGQLKAHIYACRKEMGEPVKKVDPSGKLRVGEETCVVCKHQSLKYTPRAKNVRCPEEPWVQCDVCKGWVHQVCSLFNSRLNSTGVQYLCPICQLEALKVRPQLERPQKPPDMDAGSLPNCPLSRHLEERLKVALVKEWEARARAAGTKDVPKADSLTVRVVYSKGRTCRVGKNFRLAFQKEGAMSFPYRQRVIMLFQKIDGVDVLIFCMYAQEYGPDAPAPNTGWVYLAYVDSIKYFQPNILAGNSEVPLRTLVYHELLLGYMAFVRHFGYHSMFIWACPPGGKDNDYIMNCHPPSQKIPTQGRLRRWYLELLQQARGEGLVTEFTNMTEVLQRKQGAFVSALDIPYFDGDYWPEEAEKLLGGLLNKGTRGRVSAGMPMGTCGRGRAERKSTDQELMDSLRACQSASAWQNFLVARFKERCGVCRDVIEPGPMWAFHAPVPSSDGSPFLRRSTDGLSCRNDGAFLACPSCHQGAGRMDALKLPAGLLPRQFTKELCKPATLRTIPSDVELPCSFLETRDLFLRVCQWNHYEFDSLRKAKHSSLMILYHLRHPGVAVLPATCHVCQERLDDDYSWKCPVCLEFRFCENCYSSGLRHVHTLEHVGPLHFGSSVKGKGVAGKKNESVKGEQIEKSSHTKVSSTPQEVAAPVPGPSAQADPPKPTTTTTSALFHKNLKLLLHAQDCRADPCRRPGCARAKSLIAHVEAGCSEDECQHCIRFGQFMNQHAKLCRDGNCPLKWCAAFKKKRVGEAPLEQRVAKRARAE